MSDAYPTPATPLPWKQGVFANHVDDWAYAVRAANAFPHLVAALESLQDWAPGTAKRALAIARGEVMP